MRRLLTLLAMTAAAAAAQQPLTLQQILSAPYALSLTAAPAGNHFVWIENAEGRRNIWIGSKGEPAKQLTHYTEDDGLDIASLTWSPDATAIAYTRGAPNGADGKPANPAHLQHSTASEIFVLPVAGGTPIRITEGHSPLFTRDGKTILFTRSGQIWGARLLPPKPVAKTSAPPDQQSLLDGVVALISALPVPDTAKQLVFDPGAASNLTLSPDGKLLAYVSHRSRNLIALYNFDTRELRFLSTSTANDTAPIFSPDGKQVAWLRAPSTKVPEFATNRTSPEPWSIELADVATGAIRTVFTAEANKSGSVLPHLSSGEPHLFFAAGNRILFFSEADGWVHLYSIDPLDPTPKLLTPGNSEVEDVTMSRDGRRLAYASNASLDREDRSDMRNIWMLDLTNPAAHPESPTYDPAFQNMDTHSAIAADGSLAFIETNAQEPAFVAMEPSEEAGIIALHSNRLPAGYPQETFADRGRSLISPLFVVFSSKNGCPNHTETRAQLDLCSASPLSAGLKLHAQLFRPHADEQNSAHKKFPAIIFIHGGPDRQMLLGYPPIDYYSNMYAMNEYLALHGYIVLSVNYRCGIGYGLNFRQCEHSGADGAAEYADVLAAAAYLRSRDDVDTAHIGIWGGSYGGYLTALALARNSDIFAAGVDFHGVAEWSLEANAKANWLYGPDVEKIAALAHASSPMADIAKWRSPVLLIAGDDDPDVAYAQTTTLAAALRARKVPVEELVFPDEVHDFLLHKDWLAAFQATADFFDRTLKPAPTSHSGTNSH